MWKKIICTMLILSLLCSMAGCGKKKETSSSKKQAASVENKKLDLESPVISIGGITVSYEEVLTYLYFLKSDYNGTLGSGIWNVMIDEDTTISKKALEETIYLITEVKIIADKAPSHSVELNFDEKDGIEQQVDDYLNQVSPEDIEKYHLRKDVLMTIYEENMIANKMFDVCLNGVDTEISDEDAKQITVQYLLVMTKGTTRNGLKMDVDEAGKATLREKAVSLCEQAQKTDNFVAFAEENSDEATVEQTLGYGDKSDEFVKAAMLLKTGEYSSVVDTPEGYYVIYCVNDNEPEATAKKKEDIIFEAQKQIFEQQYESWEKEYEVKVSKLLWKSDFFTS